MECCAVDSLEIIRGQNVGTRPGNIQTRDNRSRHFQPITSQAAYVVVDVALITMIIIVINNIIL